MLLLKIFNVKKRSVLITLFILTGTYVVLDYNKVFFEPKIRKYSPNDVVRCETDLKSHDKIVDDYYLERDNWQTSNLGSILFKNEHPAAYQVAERKNKTFLVLVWQHWDWLKKRHLENFQSHKNGIPKVLKDCSVKNCMFTGDDSKINKADAVIIHMMKGVYPVVKKRNLKQRWIFLSDESPVNTFTLTRTPPKLSNLSGIFNWTMTYRSDSDIPVPYGRTIPLEQPAPIELCSGNFQDTLKKLVPYWEKKQFVVLVMILVSNCQPQRLNFINALRKHIAVDIHGKCSDSNKHTCPGHFKKECNVTKNYLFYLVLENTSCRQYLSEKIFHHAYAKGAIPVVLGPPLQDCKKLLPPFSYLHVDHYKDVRQLAIHMEQIANDYEALLFYHSWRKHFTVVNEHGFFGTRSFHLCRVCEALNYNEDDENVYDLDELKLFFSRKISCDMNFYKRKW